MNHNFRYWQKMRYDLNAKLEQLGPFTFFYTLSCGDKRWNEIIATVVLKKFPNLNIMHLNEEKGKSENTKESGDKWVEDFDSDEEANVDPEENVKIIDDLEVPSSYFVHEKVATENYNESKKCPIHEYSDGFCERTQLLDYFDKKQGKNYFRPQFWT